MDAELTEFIKGEALAIGFQTVGVCSADPAETWDAFQSWLEAGSHGTMGYLARHAELRRGVRNLLPSARSVIAVGLNYCQPNPPRRGEPHIAKYAIGRDYHKVIRSKLRRLERIVTSRFPGACFRICVDSAPVLEREYAQRAGLGWFGKNTMLIDSKRGSWFFIGLMLTDLELEPDLPASGGCGSCRACIDACPTGCIELRDGRWQVEARRCISYLTIEHHGPIPDDLRPKIGGWTFGCDVCQDVCPFNAPRPIQPLRAAVTSEPDFLKGRQWPKLEELAQIDRSQWDHLTQGSAVRRAGLEGLRRNARINLEHLDSEAP